ncbi:MAG: hypothetical protein IKY83_07065, partial [Proteobacteria bacterium]|nr:hypothetical protein [Pseudomonadota bacterium]
GTRFARYTTHAVFTMPWAHASPDTRRTPCSQCLGHTLRPIHDARRVHNAPGTRFARYTTHAVFTMPQAHASPDTRRTLPTENAFRFSDN